MQRQRLSMQRLLHACTHERTFVRSDLRDAVTHEAQPNNTNLQGASAGLAASCLCEKGRTAAEGTACRQN